MAVVFGVGFVFLLIGIATMAADSDWIHVGASLMLAGTLICAVSGSAIALSHRDKHYVPLSQRANTACKQHERVAQTDFAHSTVTCRDGTVVTIK
jgi:hypothetical protein